MQGLRLKMWLVAERQDPVREIRIPTRPTRGAFDRAEHPALRGRIEDSICLRELQPIQFFPDGAGVFRAHDYDLARAEIFPGSNQMAEHGRVPPGQKHFGLAHSLGLTGGENHHAIGKR